MVEVESGHGKLSGFAHGLQALGVFEQSFQAVRECGGVPWWHDESIDAFGDNASAIRCGDDRETVRHGFELSESEAI